MAKGKRFQLRRLARLIMLAVVLGCGPVIAGGNPDAIEPFDSNSWETLIPDSCLSYFDGCNNCRRESGKMAACTRKACSAWQQPRCLDEQDPGADPGEGKRVDFRCEDGNTFSVFYQWDDQQTRLGESEIVLKDDQSLERHRLQRERSASGEKYAGPSGISFFGKGNEALVYQGDVRLYTGCRAS